MKSDLSKENEPHKFTGDQTSNGICGEVYPNEYGVIVDIKEGNKPESQERGITRKSLIGKKFSASFGSWTWSWLNEEEDLNEYKPVIDGRLEDGRYFEVHQVKIRKLNSNEI